MQPQELTLFLSAVPDPMLIVDGDGRVSGANPAALDVFGAWIIGHSYVAALRQPALLAQIDRVLNGADHGESQYGIHDPAGDTAYRVRITGRHPGAILHFSDISHIGAAEESRRDFVANVSHELRTPLTALIGFIETLQGPARDDPSARERFLNIMAAEAGRMNRLVGDLLSLSRVESEERVRPTGQVDVGALIVSVIGTLKPLADEGGIQVELEQPATPVSITGDHDQLSQVFTNLIENALKYGGSGGRVTVRISPSGHDPALRTTGVQIQVTDNGPGIDPIHLPRLTERFYRADSHRSREVGGTGLGLAIVKHIVNRHRGRLTVTSELGQGAVFTVILPIRLESQATLS